MIVVDTSAWVEHIRGRSHPVAATLEALIQERADLAITEAVLMEVLAGCSAATMPRIRSRLLALPILRVEGLADYEEAARIYRACRDAGQTVRNQLDCLIAVPTIRHGASLLHNDRDFETIARHTSLRLEPVEPLGPREGRDLREQPHLWKAGTARAAARRPRRARLAPARRSRTAAR